MYFIKYLKIYYYHPSLKSILPCFSQLWIPFIAPLILVLAFWNGLSDARFMPSSVSHITLAMPVDLITANWASLWTPAFSSQKRSPWINFDKNNQFINSETSKILLGLGWPRKKMKFEGVWFPNLKIEKNSRLRKMPNFEKINKIVLIWIFFSLLSAEIHISRCEKFLT